MTTLTAESPAALPPPTAVLKQKPKRKPIDPLSPHGVRLGVVARLVKPETFKVKGAWGRELHALKRLQLDFNDDCFWISLHPAERLDTLVWFMGSYGKAALKKEWNLFHFAKEQEQQQMEAQVQRQNAIDSQDSNNMMEDAGESERVVKPRQTVVSWADGETD